MAALNMNDILSPSAYERYEELLNNGTINQTANTVIINKITGSYLNNKRGAKAKSLARKIYKNLDFSISEASDESKNPRHLEFYIKEHADCALLSTDIKNGSLNNTVLKTVDDVISGISQAPQKTNPVVSAPSKPEPVVSAPPEPQPVPDEEQIDAELANELAEQQKEEERRRKAAEDKKKSAEKPKREDNNHDTSEKPSTGKDNFSQDLEALRKSHPGKDKETTEWIMKRILKDTSQLKDYSFGRGDFRLSFQKDKENDHTDVYISLNAKDNKTVPLAHFRAFPDGNVTDMAKNIDAVYIKAAEAEAENHVDEIQPDPEAAEEIKEDIRQSADTALSQTDLSKPGYSKFLDEESNDILMSISDLSEEDKAIAGSMIDDLIYRSNKNKMDNNLGLAVWQHNERHVEKDDLLEYVTKIKPEIQNTKQRLINEKSDEIMRNIVIDINKNNELSDIDKDFLESLSKTKDRSIKELMAERDSLLREINALKVQIGAETTNMSLIGGDTERSAHLQQMTGQLSVLVNQALENNRELVGAQKNEELSPKERNEIAIAQKAEEMKRDDGHGLLHLIRDVSGQLLDAINDKFIEREHRSVVKEETLLTIEQEAMEKRYRNYLASAYAYEMAAKTRLTKSLNLYQSRNEPLSDKQKAFVNREAQRIQKYDNQLSVIRQEYENSLEDSISRADMIAAKRETVGLNTDKKILKISDDLRNSSSIENARKNGMTAGEKFMSDHRLKRDFFSDEYGIIFHDRVSKAVSMAKDSEKKPKNTRSEPAGR